MSTPSVYTINRCGIAQQFPLLESLSLPNLSNLLKGGHLMGNIASSGRLRSLFRETEVGSLLVSFKRESVQTQDLQVALESFQECNISIIMELERF